MDVLKILEILLQIVKAVKFLLEVLIFLCQLWDQFTGM